MRSFYLILYLFLNLLCIAQDVQYSQFYAAPLYLNPAFTGANSCSRFSANYRQQWLGVPGQFKSFLASYDHSFAKNNSSLGLLISKDQAGSGKLGATSAGLIYSYQIRLTRKWTVNAGLQGSFTQKSVNFSDLHFVDQLLTNSSTTVENPLYQRVNFFDFSSGLLVFSKNFWAGFSAHHMNTPNQALVGEKSPLPVKYSVHAGIELPVGNSDNKKRNISKTSITPAFNFKNQGKFNQLDIGVYYKYEPLIVGIWYRGIPVMKTFDNNTNNDALIFIVGLSVARLNIGYSYDITISKLAPSSKGSHEITLSYQFCDPNKLKKRKNLSRVVTCPKF